MKIKVEETYVNLNEVSAIGKIFRRTTSPFNNSNYHFAFHLYLKSGIKIKVENPNEIHYDSDDQFVLKIKKSTIDLRERIINAWSKFEEIENFTFDDNAGQFIYNNITLEEVEEVTNNINKVFNSKLW